MPPTASSAGPASSVIAPKKFSRSTKTLVKSVPKPIEERPKKPAVVEFIEFDDDDDGKRIYHVLILIEILLKISFYCFPCLSRFPWVWFR